ncbi:MAG: hypothetical protein ACAI25_12705 [Planctomycetota bacterium]
MIRPALLGLLALSCAATGCRSHHRRASDERVTHREYSPWHAPSARREPPRLDLSDEQLARALETANVKATERHEKALDVVARARGFETPGVAAAVRECYALGDREAAAELADGRRGVVEWDRAAQLARVDCIYRRRGHVGGALEVTVRRKKGVEGPIAVAFPPGTYGVAADGRGEARDDRRGDRWTRPDDDRRYGEWPSQQDLALLEAPVIFLGEDDRSRTVLVPIACASFESGPPAGEQRYELRRFEAGSKVDRLLVALCAEASQKTSEPEAQLAVWLARNDISWDDFVSKGGDRGGLLTFGSSNRILPRHGKGAAKLLIEAGVNPGYSPFFADHKTLVAEPAAAAAPEPREESVAPDGTTP